MVYWPWLAIAFWLGWLVHLQAVKMGVRNMRKQGMKIIFPHAATDACQS